MEKTLKVKVVQDRFQRNLVALENPPGEGAELYPKSLRLLAAALLQAADDCEKVSPTPFHEDKQYEYAI